MSHTQWVPLHVHSQYSVLDATAAVEGIARKAAAYSIPACALTDHGNLFGAVDFFKACTRAGVKPIIGCEVYVAPGDRRTKERGWNNKAAYHLVLLVKNAEGYRNLCQLVSQAYIDGFYYHPRVDRELLQRHSKGLICLSACLSGEVALAATHGSEEQLLEVISWYHTLFGEDYFLELQRHGMSKEEIEAAGYLEESWLYQQHEQFIQAQERVNHKVVEMADKLSIPLVATNDSHYIAPDDWKAHEILLNIQSGEPCEIWQTDSRGNVQGKLPNPKRRSYPSHHFFFRSPEEMALLFADRPDALANTLLVEERCDFAFDFEIKHYPNFVPAELARTNYTEEERKAASERCLQQLCEEGIRRRYTEAALQEVKNHYPDRDPLDIVRARLAYEMEIILSMGMCDYLLIVWDIIDWAKRHHIPVGPGRGSGAGSIILYLIGITDLEPLRFHLFFERFINPERLSYPDIDVDICMEHRSRVMEYVVERYGEANVAQIITFGTMKAKMAIKDVGRVLSIPLARVNQIAKLVPEDPTMTLEQALELDPELHDLYEKDSEARQVVDYALRLEGSIRNTGIHAAGMIVSGEPLTNHIPTCVAKHTTMAVTQFAMKPVESLGLLKMDLLGLKTLTCIQKALEAIEKHHGLHIDPLKLPLDDPKTFSLLNVGQTLGVFQLESGGMQELARNLHLDRFEEILVVNALYRPGPMEMIPSFVNRKHGREKIEYDHPLLEPILKETYGIMVYQEQVLQIAQTLAGYTPGEGDVLRRAMGKKIHEEMAQQREKFRQGALEKGIDATTAMAIFDQMEKFAAYGFNKSHATCYGLISYITAYLKANFPGEWLAALMTCDSDDTSKVAKFIREASVMEIPITPPDINEAGEAFVATDAGIRFAMGAIKGVGKGVVQAIVEERESKGKYVSLSEFCQRIDHKRVPKKAIENLISAGAFDSIEKNRTFLKRTLEPTYQAAGLAQKEAASGEISLFSLLDTEPLEMITQEATPEGIQENPLDRLFHERELLGFFLTGHPLDLYAEAMHQLGCLPLSTSSDTEDSLIFRVAFIVEDVTTRISKQGKKFALLQVSDQHQSLELPVWPDLYEQHAELLEENRLLCGVLQKEKREGTIRSSLRWLGDLTQVSHELMAACDFAYDRAKIRMTRVGSYRNNRKKDETSVNSSLPPVELRCQLECLKLSQLLHLKEILRAHPGEHSLQLIFFEGEKRLLSLHAGGSWQVTPSDSLKESLLPLQEVIQLLS